MISTKVGSDPVSAGLSAASIRRAVDGSLSRLYVDRIDLCDAHKDDPSVPLEVSMRAFDGLIDAGKIGSVGLSALTPARIAEWITTADRIGAQRPVALMARQDPTLGQLPADVGSTIGCRE
jgi:aryl-alcohol dehydrogenase-like predicted oxidoreductase